MKKQSADIRIKALLENVIQYGEATKKIVLSINSVLHPVNMKEIVYCEADGNYTMFHLSDSKVLSVPKNIKEYEYMLKDFGFFRVNRQHIVNLSQIHSFDKSGSGVLHMTNGNELPVSVRKKELLIGRLLFF